MTGPDGQMSKRDQRREARRQQLRQQQTQRQRQRQQAIRQRRLRTGAIVLAIILAAVILGLLVAHFAFGAFGPTGPSGATSVPIQQVAHGQVIDGLACAAPPSNAHHGFTYIKLYVNGQQQAIPGGIGIVSDQHCHYPVYVPTGQPNAAAALTGDHKYVLGHLFDLWGQPLSGQQVLGHHADAAHQLTYEVAEEHGQLAPYTGDPRGIELRDHETIVIRYNSPNVTATPFTDWSHLHS